ncbi:O-antigen ligase family protein, partial [Candidatus Uhrbacteria bacterium]|nr:O-antigen ligase family protein [Candidatus Uhrbacteria bacterium]
MKFPKALPAAVTDALLVLFLFLLPWQTRLVVEQVPLAGGPWEYGTLGIYATEVLLWLAVLCGSTPHTRDFIRARAWWLAGLAFLVGLAFISLAWAIVPRVGAFAALHLLDAFLLIVLLGRTRLRGSTLAAVFIAGVLIQALVGLLQIVFQWVPASSLSGMAEHRPSSLGTSVVETGAGRFLRAYGGLPHPNILGGYLATALVLLAPFIAEARRPIRRTFVWVALVVTVVGLVITFSRSAWLGAFAGLLVIAFFLVPRSRSEARTRLSAAGALLFITVLIFGFLFRDAIAGRVRGDGRLEAMSRVERQVGAREAWSIFLAHPWRGVGIGNYTAAAHEISPGRPSWAYQPVHNVPLLVTVELGVLGVVFFLLAGLAFFGSLRRERAAPTPFRLALLGGLATLVIVSFLDHYLWSLYPGVMLVALLAGFWLHEAQKEQAVEGS